MELREMQVVVTIAERGSVSGAAAVLHLSPSSVSQALAKLELELGTPLFHRLPRGMACTSAGEAFVVAARRAIHEAEVAVQAVAAVDGLLAGRIHVATVSGYVAPIDRLVTALSALHPAVVPVLHRPRASSFVVEMVRSGVCEVGIAQRVDARPGMKVIPIAADETMVVMPARHELSDRALVRMADLAEVAMVMPATSPAHRGVIENLFAQHGIEPRIVAEVDDPHVLLDLVSSGIGLSIMPAASVPRRMEGEVVVVGLDPPLVRELCLLTRDEPMSPAAAALLELAEELLGPSPVPGPRRSV